MMKHFVEAVFFVSFAAVLVRAAVNEDYELEGRPIVKDFYHDAGELHFDDTTEEAEREYEGQQSDGGRERRFFKSCGPDITYWLIRQMKQNMDHHKIRSCRKNGIIMSSCLSDFKSLVGGGNPWDFKRTQSFVHRSCTNQCPRTVTLCDQCVNYDVPGNIHYGWVGRAANIGRLLLLSAAHMAQKGGIDDPKDQNAIKIGMDFWDILRKRSRFCSEIRSKINSLNLQGTSGCSKCTVKY